MFSQLRKRRTQEHLAQLATVVEQAQQDEDFAMARLQLRARLFIPTEVRWFCQAVGSDPFRICNPTGNDSSRIRACSFASRVTTSRTCLANRSPEERGVRR